MEEKLFIMENNLLKLEFDKIINILSRFAITEKGKQLSLDLLPFFDKSKVIKALNETTEALVLLLRKGNIPIYEILNGNITPAALHKARVLSEKLPPVHKECAFIILI